VTPRSVVGVAVTTLSLCLAGCGSDDSSAPATEAAPSSATEFLDTYVTEDGRVLRLDQGRDVVSEGQAYGMLIAQLAGREDVVDGIWAWTREHLLRSDGLISFHASETGEVLDVEAAADADVLAAYALLTATGDDAAALHKDGATLAAAVLEHEVVRDGQGRAVLAAGPWAVSSGTVNPSYWMPSVFDDLASLTGDATWSELSSTGTALLRTATDEGRLLPPDWGRLDGDSFTPTEDAAGAPGDGEYGPDAQRVPLWYAAACAPDAHELAGRWWSVLQQDDRSSAARLGLDGQVLDGTGQPIALLGAAASAAAAGDNAGAEDLGRGAREAAAGAPGYYGDAWLALSEGLGAGHLAAC
jgi:endo-1,4-beta-D-glucanase Y